MCWQKLQLRSVAIYPAISTHGNQSGSVKKISERNFRISLNFEGYFGQLLGNQLTVTLIETLQKLGMLEK